MVFDPSEPENDGTIFGRKDWIGASYGECSEDIPSNES